MSDNVSDLVFRDLDPDIPASRTFDDKWEASLREELEKLRPVRPAPRVIPAGDTGDAQGAQRALSLRRPSGRGPARRRARRRVRARG